MLLEPYREINEFSTQSVQARTKPGAMKSQESFGSAGQPDYFLVDGLAKLAPGLKTARQTGPGETAVAHLTLLHSAHTPNPRIRTTLGPAQCA